MLGLNPRHRMLVLFALMGGIGVAQSSGPEVEAVRACMAQNQPETSVIQDVELSTTGADGSTRSMVARLYGARGSGGKLAINLSVQAPSDLAGSRYLMVNRGSREDLFVYLPAAGRTRRVMGSMLEQPIWGSEFSYQDIRQLLGALDSGSLALSKDGDAQWFLKLTPDGDSQYSRIELVVEKESCVTSSAEFFQGGHKVKRITVDPQSIQKLGTRYVATQVKVENLVDQTHSSLAFEGTRYGDRISRSWLSPKGFQNAR